MCIMLFMYVAANCLPVSSTSLAPSPTTAASMITDASSSPHSGMCTAVLSESEIEILWSSANFHAFQSL